jgi:CheY-like chemotaxis protein
MSTMDNTNDNTKNTKDKKCLAWIVEDKTVNEYILKIMLNKRGFYSKSFDDGWKVIEAYKDSTQEERPSVILMDIMMPVVDGYAASKDIRKYERDNNLPRVGIIAVTACADEDQSAKARMDAGIDYCIFKPLSAIQQTDLFKHLDEICNHTIDNTVESIR